MLKINKNFDNKNKSPALSAVIGTIGRRNPTPHAENGKNKSVSGTSIPDTL